MGRLARLGDALLRERADEVDLHQRHRLLVEAERQRRLLVKEHRDNKAMTAWDSWRSQRRNRALPDARLDVLPVRLYKLYGYSAMEVAKLRDIHRTRFKSIDARPEPQLPFEYGLQRKLARAAFVTFVLLLSISLLVASIVNIDSAGLGLLWALMDLAHIVALVAAVKEFGLELDDFTIYKVASSGGHPEHPKSPCDSDPAYSGSSPQSPSQQAATRRSGRTPKPSKRARDDDDSPAHQPPKRSKGHDDDGDDDGDDSDDGDDPDDGPVSWQQKKAKKERMFPAPKRQPSDAMRDHQAAGTLKSFKFFASAYLRSNDPALKNARRIAQHLSKLTLLRSVKPLVTDKNEMTLGQRFAQAAIPGKTFRPNTLAEGQKPESGKSGDLIRFKFWESDARTELIGTSIAIPLTMLPENPAKSLLDDIHAELTRFHNTWPWEKPADNVKRLWISQALSNVLAVPRQVDQIHHSDTLTYQTQVHYINSDTGKHDRMTVSAAATDQNMSLVTVPALPALNIVEGKTRQVFRSTSDNPHYLAPPNPKKLKLPKNGSTSQAAQQKAQDAVYWVASQIQGLVTTPSRAKELLVQYRFEIGLEKGAAAKEGIYGGDADLYKFTYYRKGCKSGIFPSRRVANDFGCKVGKLKLSVHSLNAARLTPVMETIVQLFCDGRDIRRTWLESAKVADLVNMDISSGVPASSVCDCDENQALTEMHVCQGCARAVLCKARAYDNLGRLVCASCSNRDAINYNGGRDPSETLASYLARISLRRSFLRECETRKLEPSDTKSILADAWTRLKATLPGGGKLANVATADRRRFIDKWTGNDVELLGEYSLKGNNPSRRRYLPQGLVVDAVHNLGHPKNRDLKHSSDNLVVTTNACNMAKSVFPVGILHEIGCFLRRDDRDSDTARESLVQRIQEFTVVKTKQAFIHRTGGSKTSKYAKIITELVSGRPTPNEHGPWEDRAQRYVQGSVQAYSPNGENIWDDDTWNKAQQCAKSIEDYFEVQLLKLQDGTRWIGNESSNPEGLHRNSIAVLCDERLSRMRLWCNKKWDTRDTDLTLYREILFQHCASRTTKPELQWLKNKYGDRLGLPLVLWLNNPLRFSIAHREHGFGMFSGWLDERSVSVSDRIAEDEQNNMLIESWFVNSAKLDMAEDYYPELDSILRSLSIPTEYYNQNATFEGKGIIPSSEDIEDLEEDVVLEFNSNVLSSLDESTAEALEDEAIDEDEASDNDTKTTDKKTGKKATDELAGEEGSLRDDPQRVDTVMTDAPGGDADDEDEDMAGASTSLSQLDTMLINLYKRVLEDKSRQQMLATNPEVQRLLAQLRNLADEGDEQTFDSVYAVLMEKHLFPSTSEHEQE